MKRLTVPERHGWRERFEEVGFTFHSIGGSYWHEGACYEFESEEIDHIEEVTAELHEMCLKAVDHVIRRNLFSLLGIPSDFTGMIERSWARRDLSIYGRFDFSYDGKSEPKLLEYNADTPTSLFESSIAQWIWLEDVHPEYDQFNSIHEKLIDTFRSLKKRMFTFEAMYFSCVKDHEEDFLTVEYLRDVATQAGIDARSVFIEDIGFNRETGKFCDLENREIARIFKLYPWEWMIAEEFGAHLKAEVMNLHEPPWKMILSNKGILPVLWDLYPGHPNLLESSFEPLPLPGAYVRKPLFGREGANVTVYEGGFRTADTGGTYGEEGYIFQRMKKLFREGSRYAVIGSWVIGGQPAGIGIREDNSPVITDTSTFVPHFFIP